MNGENVTQPEAPELIHGSGGSRYPVPDPTTLTTEALRREVAALQVLIEQRINSLKELLDQKITSAETRIDDRHNAARGEYSVIIQAAQDFCANQFKSIEQQLARVEQLRIEQKADMKAAVDAALTAQKEAVHEQSESFAIAVAKSEAATAKQIEQLSLTTSTARDELRRGIDDTKERISDVEKSFRTSLAEVATVANAYSQQKQGGADLKSTIAWVIAGVASLASIAIIIIGTRPGG
jgi:hypothetical protein